MGQEIGLCARGASGRGQQLARDDIAAQEKAARAMTDILELAPLHFTGSQRQSWMLALQRLHASQLVSAHAHFALLCQLWGLLIQATDGFDRFLLVRILRRGQPIADQMRLEIVFFNNRAACRGEICATMPRRMTSSAISRPVHWLIGRSFGCSQAMATIWQVCSAVIWACRPGRGTSQRRSFTGKSSKEAACKPIQRMRHMRTVSTQMPNSRAICELFLSSAAARMMRPRRASCWGVPCRRTSASTSVRSVSLKVSRSGLGPRMLRFLLLVCDLIILQTYFSRNVLVFLPGETLYAGTPKHYSVVKVLCLYSLTGVKKWKEFLCLRAAALSSPSLKGKGSSRADWINHRSSRAMKCALIVTIQ